MTHARAFSLLELLIAITLAAVVSTAAVSVTMAIYRSTTALEQQAAADIEAKLLVDHITNAALQVGGGAVRPWQGLSTSCADGTDMPACDGADRLHIVTVDDDLPSCTVAAWDGTSSTLTANSVGGVCCLDAFAGAQDVVIIPNISAGGGWQMKRCTPAGGCSCNLAPIANATDAAPASGVTVTAASWVGGTVAPASQVSFYLDKANHSLFQRVDLDGAVSGSGTAAESVLISDRVHDFQVQFGFDNDPADGVLDDIWQNSADPAIASDLRMIRPGVIVGVPTPARDTPSSASLFGGPAISVERGRLLRSAHGAVALRNILVFF